MGPVVPVKLPSFFSHVRMLRTLFGYTVTANAAFWIPFTGDLELEEEKSPSLMLVTDKTSCLLRPIAGLGIHLPLPGIRIGILLSRDPQKSPDWVSPQLGCNRRSKVSELERNRRTGYLFAAGGYPTAGLGIQNGLIAALMYPFWHRY